MRCVSFCTAESYHIAAIAVFFRNKGYIVKRHRKVLHVTQPEEKGNIFIFSYGCFITWGLNHHAETKFAEQLEQFSDNPLKNIEIDHFSYKIGDKTQMATHSRFNVDIITLESDSPQLKLAISHGIAQSIQLKAYESAVRKTIKKNDCYPKQLATTGRISLSQNKIAKQMGQIFLARSSINLNSDYLGTPEFFWKYPSLESYYNMAEKFLEIPRRVSALNKKLNVLHELLDMLASQLQYRHMNLLETIIICLFLFDITLTLFTTFLYK